MNRKILYITGTRADYGLMRSVLFEMERNPEIDLEIAVTGMHLMKEFGMTVTDVEKDGFTIHIIKDIFKDDSKESMVHFIGDFINDLSKIIIKINPDIILLLGDRGEMLAGAIVGAYLNIPTAHLHGGEITSTVDEYARHAITKLVNIHLPATKKSAERILKMGESPENIFLVGAPGLDNIHNKKLTAPDEIGRNYNLSPSEPIILVVQHPVSLESENSSKQIQATMDAILDLKIQTIIIYPNADAGGREIIKSISKYESYPFIQTFKSIPSEDYMSLMQIVNVIVGNSSSGIIEAPSFKLPAVNIGYRQQGRERALNVIDVDYNKEEIEKAILKAIYDKEFIDMIHNSENPYGDGKTSQKVVKILRDIKLNQELLEKKLNL